MHNYDVLAHPLFDEKDDQFSNTCFSSNYEHHDPKQPYTLKISHCDNIQIVNDCQI